MVREIKIKTIERYDGKARIYIIARDDALFRYEGEVEAEEDGDVFWQPTNVSGLFETPEEAEVNARNEVPWLKK